MREIRTRKLDYRHIRWKVYAQEAGLPTETSAELLNDLERLVLSPYQLS